MDVDVTGAAKFRPTGPLFVLWGVSPTLLLVITGMVLNTNVPLESEAFPSQQVNFVFYVIAAILYSWSLRLVWDRIENIPPKIPCGSTDRYCGAMGEFYSRNRRVLCGGRAGPAGGIAPGSGTASCG